VPVNRPTKPHGQEWLCSSAFSIVSDHGVLEVGSFQLHVGQIDFAEAGERQVRAGKIRAAKICLPQDGPPQHRFVQFRGTQVPAKQLRAAQIGLAQIRAFEQGLRKIAISQIRLSHVSSAQIRVAEFRSPQVGFAQIAAREVGSSQIAFLQVRAGKIGAGKIGAFPARMPLMEFLVGLQNVLKLFTFVSNGFRLSLTGSAARTQRQRPSHGYQIKSACPYSTEFEPRHQPGGILNTILA
jgi:hypothetical protein